MKSALMKTAKEMATQKKAFLSRPKSTLRTCGMTSVLIAIVTYSPRLTGSVARFILGKKSQTEI